MDTSSEGSRLTGKHTQIGRRNFQVTPASRTRHIGSKVQSGESMQAGRHSHGGRKTQGGHAGKGDVYVGR